jgi:hypothetical protein
MAAPTWVTYNGFLGTITQRTPVNIPITTNGSDTRFSLIAGEFPPGVQLDITTTSTSATTPGIVYFKVTDGVGRNDFVIKLTDPVKIQNARDQLNGVVPKLHITGLIIKSTVDYNPNYNYHYDPDTIDFFEYAMEVCDATFDYTEEYLDEAGGAFLPGLRLCPWGSELLEEVSLTPATTTGFIFGFPEAVPTTTESRFVIRASNAGGINDKTFRIDVTGGTSPLWFTPEGMLPIGTSGEYFAINRQMVDYQLVALANTLLDNMKVRYYIEDGDGVLPKGLRLTEDGRIVGTIAVVTVQDADASQMQTYGFDLLRYDGFGYDLTPITPATINLPKFIPVHEKFYVTASDGFNSTKQLFEIQIVDANSLRADTGYITTDEKYFLSNDSFLFAQNWLNPANLGIRRAAEYQIIPISLYDPTPNQGPTTWEWDALTVNPEIQCRANSAIDPNTYRQTTNLAGDNRLFVKNCSSLPQIGQQFRFDTYMSGVTNTTYTITTVTGNTSLCTLGFTQLNTTTNTLIDDIPDDAIFYIGSPSVHPKGFKLDPVTGNLYGQIPFIPSYSIDYKFTIRMVRTNSNNRDVIKYDRVFSLTLQGNVNTDLQWLTTSTVGVIKTGYQSELFVQAEHSTDPSIKMVYSIVDGELPPGLTFKSDGTIIGKIPYKNSITTVDAFSDPPTTDEFNEGSLDFVIDGGVSTIDRDYTFTVQATDIYSSSAINKRFNIVIGDNSLTPFSTLYVKPFMYKDKRKSYRYFVNDTSIFDPRVMYRPADPAFGIQSELKLIIEHGLETLNLAEYILGFQKYFYNKRFFFGDVKTLPAEDERGNHVYDVVYIDIIDSQMIANRSPDTMQFYINQNIASYQIASLDNWQVALESIPILGRTIMVDEYLRPRFMRTIQQTTGAPLGFIKAVPLCYTKPGQGPTVVKKVQLSGFDFKLLDFEVDRLIITNTIDFAVDKYLKFPITDVDNTRVIDVIAGPDGIILQTEDGQDLFT